MAFQCAVRLFFGVNNDWQTALSEVGTGRTCAFTLGDDSILYCRVLGTELHTDCIVAYVEGFRSYAIKPN